MLLAVLLLGTFLAGCGKDAEITKDETNAVENAETENTKDNQKDEEMYLGVSFPSLANAFFTTTSDQIEAKCKEEGVRVEIVSCEGDISLQIEQLENFATMGVTHVVVNSLDLSSIQDTMKKLREEGIHVYYFGTIPSDIDSYDSCSALDQAAVGDLQAQAAADWIEKTYPDAKEGSIEVAAIISTANQDMIDRSEAMQKLEKYTSKAKVVVTYDVIGKTDMNTSTQEYVDILFSEHPDVKAIMTVDVNCGLGANEAIMRISSINAEEIGVFSADFDDAMAFQIFQSTEGKSVLRSAVKLFKEDDNGKAILDVLQGRVDLDENKCFYGESLLITVDNLSDFYEE